MEPAFQPDKVDLGVYDWWERSGKLSRSVNGNEVFSMVIPPPNVTGQLHIGHALTVTIEDALVRWRKMQGKKAVWIPGVDHAGIATQSVVEKRLSKDKGLTRHNLGRERFLDEVWKWYEQYNGRIDMQLRRLGASLNWEDKVFTMDHDRATAVTEAFVQLYDRGLIYRSTKLINWSSYLQTVISDLEVDYVDIPSFSKRLVPGVSKPVEFGVMHSFAYPVEGGGEIVVSTTRLETMLGDVAVVVHPEDDRYKEFHGKFVIHPFTNQRLPILKDSILVDMKIGTGALKITPAHDINDYECGIRHELPLVNIFNRDGTVNNVGDGSWSGMHRFLVRDQLVQTLDSLDLYRGKQANPMRLALCSRSGDVIEPMLQPQWFVNCDQMAKRSLEYVSNETLIIRPKYHEKTWSHFLENIQHWCISRQLWWGHRIPAYQVFINNENSGEWVIARNENEALEKARLLFSGETTVEQDPDVLDTWFSSALFPLAALGWPNLDSPLLKQAYPLSLMETGSDILFFWVARMMFLCSELYPGVPFHKVFLHPMVRDKDGRKMSKSLGNVIDPIHVIEGRSLEELETSIREGNLADKQVKLALKNLKTEFPKGIPACGTDALRLSLSSCLHHGPAINLDINRVVLWRQFCNKIWNATMYVLSQKDLRKVDDVKVTHLPSKWILSRFASCIDECSTSMENCEFSKVTNAAQDFFINDLCDVFLELSKQTSQTPTERQEAVDTLVFCLDNYYRLLHPLAPYVTEELWHRLNKAQGNLDTTVALVDLPYPTAQGCITFDETSEKEMNLVLDTVRGARGLRQKLAGILDSKQLHEKIEIVLSEENMILRENVERIKHMTRMRNVSFVKNPTNALSLGMTVRPGVTVRLVLVVDHEDIHKLETEALRLQKKHLKISQIRDNMVSKTTSPKYLEKAPIDIQQRDKLAIDEQNAELLTISESLTTLKTLL